MKPFGRSAQGAPFVAITGTNGKSTTTALVAHLFSTFGFPVEVGGNIGTPILALNPPDNSRVHVIECSSYQIDLAPSLDPSVGILLNVTPDHLDRHGTMENYAAIKARLVHAADLSVIGVDDAYTRAIANELRVAGRNVTKSPRRGRRSPMGSSSRAEASGVKAAAARPSSRIFPASPRCAARIMARTPPPPSRRWGRSASIMRASRRGSPPFRGWRIGWKRSAGSARCCSSMIRKRPTPTPPKRRCSRSKTSSGSWGGARRRAASSRCGLYSTGSSRAI